MSLQLREFLPIQRIKEMLENFYALTGFGCRMIDSDNKQLFSIGEISLCNNFYKTNKKGLKKCTDCGIYKESEYKNHPYYLYKCINGMH